MSLVQYSNQLTKREKSEARAFRRSECSGESHARARSHTSFRNWCSYCVRARAADDPHHRQPTKNQSSRSSWPTATFCRTHRQRGVVHNPGTCTISSTEGRGKRWNERARRMVSPGTTCNLQPHVLRNTLDPGRGGGFWLRGRRTHTLFLIRTTVGAPVGEEVVDQLLILVFPSATKTVPFIRNSFKEGTGLEGFHLTSEHTLVSLPVNMRTNFTTIPSAHLLHEETPYTQKLPMTSADALLSPR